MRLKRITSVLLMFLLLCCNISVFATVDINDCEYSYECFEICGVHILCKIFNSISNVWMLITGHDTISIEAVVLSLCIFIIVFIVLNSINYILKKKIKKNNNKELITFSKILNILTYIYSIYLLLIFILLLFFSKLLTDSLCIFLVVPIVLLIGLLM